MEENNIIEFSKIMAGLAENFSSELTENGLSMRFEALKEYSITQIRQSAMVILKTRKFTTMPTVADFIEAIEGNKYDLADIQKGIVMGAINRYHPNQKFSDPITQVVVDQIGWGRIGQANKAEIPFILKDFKELYITYKKAESGHILAAPDRFKKIANNSTKAIK